jgi:hypothetical protein
VSHGGKYGRPIGNRVFEKAPRAVRSDDRDPAVEMKQRQQRERARAREQLQRHRQHVIGAAGKA